MKIYKMVYDGSRRFKLLKRLVLYHQTKSHKISLLALSKFKSMESPGNKILILGCKEWIPRLQPRLKPDVILYRINSINHLILKYESNVFLRV